MTRTPMAFPPRLMDELARVFARAAVDRLLQEGTREQQRNGLGRVGSAANRFKPDQDGDETSEAAANR